MLLNNNLYVFFVFRWHNANLNVKVPVDFQHLKTKVTENTLTGKEKYVTKFSAVTPTDIKGAKEKIEVLLFFNKEITWQLLYLNSFMCVNNRRLR